MEEVNASHALQEVASVKKMVLHTELIVLPASWQESHHYTKEKQQGMHSRLEYRDSLRLEDEENPLWKHCLVYHHGIRVEFNMKVLGVHRSPLVR